MTMQKLAALAGVSVSTVSKAFSHSPEISEQVKEKIFRIARESGCYDKYAKDTFSAPVIGVICPEFKSRLYSTQLSLFEAQIQARGGVMLAASSDFDEKKQESILRFFTEYAKVDGVIGYSLKTQKPFSVPIVNLGEASAVYDTVHVSTSHAMMAAVSLLKGNGHHRIAFLGEGYTKKSLEEFLCAMRESKLPIENAYVYKASRARFEEAGYNGMRTLLSLPLPPTAVIAAYDDIALGATKAISECGLSIPDDISLIGIGDIKEAPFFPSALSSITYFNEDYCEIVTDLLFERIGHIGTYTPRHIMCSAELVVRASVGKAKA